MKPRPFVEEIAQDLLPGRALDIACGDGRNAVWLAERGWRVTAVDKSPAISRTDIEVHTADLERHEFAIEESAWDLIVVSYYLQTDLFGPVLRGLKPGGVAIIIVHMFEPGHESSCFSLQPGQLREYFRECNVLAYREGKSEPTSRAVAQIAVQA